MLPFELILRLWAKLRGLLLPQLLSIPDPEIIDASFKVDEEQLRHYKPGHFYPVYIGNIYESRYQVLSKLGYGSCSTVWLARDITFGISPPRVFLY